MRTDRLKTLIDFMKELPDEKFDFSVFFAKFNADKTCDTVCCAAGWLHKVDPEEWSIAEEGDYSHLVLRNHPEDAEHFLLSAYFECELNDVGRIFYYKGDRVAPGAELESDATRSEWIAHAESVLSEWEDKIQDCSEETQ